MDVDVIDLSMAGPCTPDCCQLSPMLCSQRSVQEFTFPRPAARSKEWPRVLPQWRSKFIIEEARKQNNGYQYKPVVPQRLHNLDNSRIGDLCVHDSHVEMANGRRGLTFTDRTSMSTGKTAVALLYQHAEGMSLPTAVEHLTIAVLM